MTRMLKSCLLLAALGTCATAQAFTYPDFSNIADLQLNGSSAVTREGVLRITPPQPNLAGSVFTKFGVEARGFKTSFAFRIRAAGGTPPDCVGEPGGEGLTLTMQRTEPTALGQPGPGMGYVGIGTTSAPGGSIAIEFDTACEGSRNDPSSNHVAIVAGGVNIHTTLPAVDVGGRFDDGRTWYAWVEYDGTALEVRVRPRPVRPARPTIHWNVDVPLTIGGDCGCLGFTAATGTRVGRHELLNWTYEPRSFPGLVSGTKWHTDSGPPPTCSQLKK